MYLTERAQAAQDRIGNAPVSDPMEMGMGVLALARVVVDLATEVRQLRAIIEAQAMTP